MTHWHKTAYSILITSALAFAPTISVLAQSNSRDRPRNRTEILSPEKIVYMHRNDRSDCSANSVSCWITVETQGQLLNPSNWLGTGRSSTAGLWYLDLDLIYRQSGQTFSQFLTRTSNAPCGFQVSDGRVLRLDRQSRRRPGCEQIVGNVRITPPAYPSTLGFLNKQLEDAESESSAAAFYVFRNRAAGETVVGVLASPLGPVIVEPREDIAAPITLNDIENNQTSAQIELNSGEFAFILDNGRFVKGEFSIRRFYEDHPILTVGLLNRPEDIAYVEALEGEEEELVEDIRESTLKALNEQPEPGPFEVTNLNSSDFSSIPQCQLIDTDILCF